MAQSRAKIALQFEPCDDLGSASPDKSSERQATDVATCPDEKSFSLQKIAAIAVGVALTAFLAATGHLAISLGIVGLGILGSLLYAWGNWILNNIPEA